MLYDSQFPLTQRCMLSSGSMCEGFNGPCHGLSLRGMALRLCLADGWTISTRSSVMVSGRSACQGIFWSGLASPRLFYYVRILPQLNMHMNYAEIPIGWVYMMASSNNSTSQGSSGPAFLNAFEECLATGPNSFRLSYQK